MHPSHRRSSGSLISARWQTVAAALFALFLFALLAATISFAQTSGDNGFGRAFASNVSGDNQLQGNPSGIQYREGTKLVDRAGHFRVQGDQVFFHLDGEQHRFTGLPNLNLERVARAITDDPTQLDWSVTGVVTEYRGANFLLVERAVLKTKGGRALRRD